MPEVPFYPNAEDGNHCMVAIYRSIFEYLQGTKYTMEEMEQFVGYQDHRAAWTLLPLTKMAAAGFDIRMIEPFDYRAYAAKGEDYLAQAFNKDKARWLLAHSNISDITPSIPAFLRTVRWENRQAILQDIDNMLTEGRLVFVTLNSRALNNLDGYAEHAVLIFGRQGSDYLLHDPGPPAHPHRSVPRAQLWEAMGGHKNTSEVTGFKLRTKAGQRLDQYVASEKPRLSRAFAAKLIDKGDVLVNGKPSKAGLKLQENDTVEINYDDSQLDVIPDIDLPVIYEDADCIVINKPAGVLTHAQGTFNGEASVATFLRSKVDGDLQGDRAGIVHRLDRATSGVLICAKNQGALSWLQKQFADRKARKTYMAIVKGTLRQPEAVIDMPIQRNPKAPATFRASPGGKPAITHYKVIKETPGLSLLELSPQTGRTHQLRVHLQKIGHPIIGDPLYGSGTYGDRLFLHAQSLEITLPSGETKTFTAPVPPEFEERMR